MPKCPTITRSGNSCKGVVQPGATYCVAHDPARTDERRRSASKAGKSRPSKDLLAVRAQLQQLADGVLAGEVDRSNASVAGQLLNIKLRTVEVERKLHETQELERRLEELEESIEQNNQSNGSGQRSRAWG